MNKLCNALFSLILCAALASPCAAENKKPPVDVKFSGSTVTAKGVTPKASVLFFAVVSEATPWAEGRGKLEAVVADVDGDGIVLYNMPSGAAVPRRSIWAVCDLEDGDLIVTAPENYVPRRVELPGNGLKRGANGQIEKLELASSQWLEIAVVRPKQGAWTATVYDGGLGDEDRSNNGHILRGFSGFKSVAGAESPGHLTGRDVVVVIDAGMMRYYASRIEQ